MSSIEKALALQIAAEVASISGVADLHAGRYGEVALLYPGERVRGLKLTDGVLEVHVIASLNDARRTLIGPSPALAELGEHIRSRVSALCTYPIDVTIDDIV